MASTRPPESPLAANSCCAAVRIDSRVRSGSRRCVRDFVFAMASRQAAVEALIDRVGGRSYRPGNHAVTTNTRRASRTMRRLFNIGVRMKITATVALAILVALGASPAAAQKITFTLNWVAGGDHAPYFYAQKMGWYKQAG